MNEAPQVQDHPKESSIGFTIITKNRKFYLFADSEDIKIKFLYAFASLKNIPVRPDFFIYHDQFLELSSDKKQKDMPEYKKDKESIIIKKEIPPHDKNKETHSEIGRASCRERVYVLV